MTRWIWVGLLLAASCSKKKSADHGTPIVPDPPALTRDECTRLYAHIDKVTQVSFRDVDTCVSELPRTAFECAMKTDLMSGMQDCLDHVPPFQIGAMQDGHQAAQKLYEAANAYYAKHHAYPAVTTDFVPTGAPWACQGNVRSKHPPHPADWAGPPWADLDFAMTEPTLVSLKYESDGKTSFKITVAADPDCTGKPDLTTTTSAPPADAQPDAAPPDGGGTP